MKETSSKCLMMINSRYKQSALRVFINGFPIEDDMGKMGKGFTSANE
jgi:hypothetical protein